MVKWFADLMLIGIVGFVTYVLCIAVERKTIGQLIILVCILLVANKTIVDLKPVIDKLYEAKQEFDDIQEFKDQIGNSPILNWAPGTGLIKDQQEWAK